MGKLFEAVMLHRPHIIEAHLVGVLDLREYLSPLVVFLAWIVWTRHLDFIHQCEFHVATHDAPLRGESIRRRYDDLNSVQHEIGVFIQADGPAGGHYHGSIGLLDDHRSAFYSANILPAANRGLQHAMPAPEVHLTRAAIPVRCA